ncbi:replication initiation and membrane attachment family protein [Geomicrobium sp. JSM 1781026]|uniref:replication initiation and membrane attachment family protein n=1 Tax=Geomicrobium sp. JSM 1781026 TaxID=3344580 RepID=UPI0035C14E88
MSWTWSEVRPVDGYRVRMMGPFSEMDQKALVLLYQPLIGALAVNVYLTLYYRLERDTYMCQGSTHRELMVTLGEQMHLILEARKKLEAIGLLTTLMQHQNDGEDRMFVYDLKTPLSAKEFLEDPLLGVFLQNRIGRNRFKEVRRRFSTSKLTGEWEDKTVAFNDVFQAIKDSELQQDPVDEHVDTATSRQTEQPVIAGEPLDPVTLKTFLPPFFLQEKLLTNEVLVVVQQLAFIYKIDEKTMSRFLVEAMVGDDTIDTERLRLKVKDWYRTTHGQTPPKLGMRTSKASQDSSKQPVSEDDKMVQYYERISPLDLLTSLSDGASVSPADLRLAESLVHDYQFSPGVANTLIDYVMRTNDKKLDAALVQKIAGHWSRKRIKTVEEAMRLAKQEYKNRKDAKHKQTNAQKATPRKARNQGSNRQDKLPKWLTEEPKETSEDTKKKKTKEDRQAFESLLEQYQRGGGE